MIKTIGLTLISAILISASCYNATDEDDVYIKPACEVEATIHHLPSCGLVVELNDGTRLYPVASGCFDAPFLGIKPAHGKKLRIAYKLVGGEEDPLCSAANIRLTCAEELEHSPSF